MGRGFLVNPYSHFPGIHGQFILWLQSGNTGQTSHSRVQPCSDSSGLLGFGGHYSATVPQPPGSDLLQQLLGCLREPSPTNHTWSQRGSHWVNTSIQRRQDCPWDQVVPSDYSQPLSFLMLWARRRFLSWGQYYPKMPRQSSASVQCFLYRGLSVPGASSVLADGEWRQKPSWLYRVLILCLQWTPHLLVGHTIPNLEKILYTADP